MLSVCVRVPICRTTRWYRKRRKRYSLLFLGGGLRAGLPGARSKAFPALLRRAGKAACLAADEFFAAQISNPPTRRAYARPVGRFLAWCQAQGIELCQVTPGAGRALHRGPARSGPHPESGAGGAAAFLRHPGDAPCRGPEPVCLRAGTARRPSADDSASARRRPASRAFPGFRAYSCRVCRASYCLSQISTVSSSSSTSVSRLPLIV